MPRLAVLRKRRRIETVLLEHRKRRQLRQRDRLGCGEELERIGIAQIHDDHRDRARLLRCRRLGDRARLPFGCGLLLGGDRRGRPPPFASLCDRDRDTAEVRALANPELHLARELHVERGTQVHVTIVDDLDDRHRGVRRRPQRFAQERRHGIYPTDGDVVQLDVDAPPALEGRVAQVPDGIAERDLHFPGISLVVNLEVVEYARLDRLRVRRLRQRRDQREHERKYAPEEPVQRDRTPAQCDFRPGRRVGFCVRAPDTRLTPERTFSQSQKSSISSPALVTTVTSTPTENDLSWRVSPRLNGSLINP